MLRQITKLWTPTRCCNTAKF